MANGHCLHSVLVWPEPNSKKIEYHFFLSKKEALIYIAETNSVAQYVYKAWTTQQLADIKDNTYVHTS